MTVDRYVTTIWGRTAIVELADGGLIAPHGPTELEVSRDGGRTWTESLPLRRKDGQPLPSGPVSQWLGLTRLASGKLVALYGRSGNGNARLMFCAVSDDEGGTWSGEYPVNLPGDRAWPYHDTLIETHTGRLVLPVRACFSGLDEERRREAAYGNVGGARVIVEGHAQYPEIDIAYIHYSDDEGRTWQRSENEIITWPEDGFRGAYAVDEPCIAETGPGKLLMLARSTVGRLVASTSEDNGTSWGRALPTELCNSYSPARLRRIPQTGDLLCVWNQVTADEIRRGYRRSRLTSAISQDGGGTWEHFKLLDCADTLDPVPYVEPDQGPSFVVARKDCGEMPANYCIFRYPNVTFHGDAALIQYDRETFDYPDCPARTHVLRAIPIDTLYDDDCVDIRLSNEIPRGVESGEGESIED